MLKYVLHASPLGAENDSIWSNNNNFIICTPPIWQGCPSLWILYGLFGVGQCVHPLKSSLTESAVWEDEDAEFRALFPFCPGRWWEPLELTCRDLCAQQSVNSWCCTQGYMDWSPELLRICLFSQDPIRCFSSWFTYTSWNSISVYICEWSLL